MDTKWNNTVDSAEPPKKRNWRGSLRAGAAFLAFLLGISLTLGSLGAALERSALQRDYDNWWEKDWQDTPAFRREAVRYLKSFLTLGVGHELHWDELTRENKTGTLYDHSWAVSSTETPVAATISADAAPDAAYQSDKNVLYCIDTVGGKHYDNLSGIATADALRDGASLPEGYNFLLVFENGEVSIWKDGEVVDVYGADRVLDDSSLWCVPGYVNFKADDDLNDVTVHFAVRETPMRYISTGSILYSHYRELQNSRQTWTQIALCFAAGVLLLVLCFPLRKSRRVADRAVAAVTRHIPTEIRFLAVVISLAGLLLPMLAVLSGGWWYEDFDYMLLRLVQGVCASVGSTAALLVFFWSVWLIRNDHRYNPKEQRRSLLRKLTGVLRRHEFTYPIQKRMRRRALFSEILTVLAIPVGIAATILCSDGFNWRDGYCVLCGGVVGTLFLLLPLLLRGHGDRALARDFGLLAGQVTAIQSGDLSSPVDLPADSDLHKTAEQLSAIQSGLKAAVAEQTRSERMKVELISNVSHDLKTPLTSILSYSELLMQEPLEPTAADYARIIRQKALRLKSMVQDVFEISKAASDQLPIQPERLDLAKLLRQTLADMDSEIQSSGLLFRVDLPDTPVMITADGGRLYRVFQNLLQNALKYSLSGSRVYLRLKTTDTAACASLSNTSRNELPEGIDFTARFVRGDESRTDGGTGLGLSVAKSFAEACGGTFRVETTADLFTAFVSFPLSAESSQ